MGEGLALPAARGAGLAAALLAGGAAAGEIDVVKDYVLQRCLPSISAGLEMPLHGLTAEDIEACGLPATRYTGEDPRVSLIKMKDVPICMVVSSPSDTPAFAAFVDEWFDNDETPFELISEQSDQMGDSRVFSWDRGVALVEVRATVNDAQSAAILSVSLVGK